ncbi:MAG TPA: hypothetical protein VL241_05895 [Gemmatimonadales bacterium]|nr:hypothetical protein [Gemmatimonadales bacterium]
MRRTALGLPLLATALLTGTGCGGAARSATPAPAEAPGLGELRDATRPFQQLDAAVAAGYAREVPDCLVHEHHGAMGYHHVNRGYLSTDLSVRRPQILLYERMPDGAYRLNAVEFIVPYRLWPRDSIAPVLMGRQLQHEDNLKLWYLHVWAWRSNPDGLFANFHPDVQCPEAQRKVFMPYAIP